MNVKLADGSSLLDGKLVTGFSDEEEDQAYSNKIAPPNMPFHLQQALNKVSGGRYEKAQQAWESHVISSPRLLLGQNPPSAHDLGIALLEVLKQKN